MQRLADAVERLDGPLDDIDALVANLRDLRWINRWLGGLALSIGAMKALAGNWRGLTVLDVGTGGADIPIGLIREAARRGQPIRVTAVDSRAEVRAAAIELEPGLPFETALSYEVHDGGSLPYPDRSFDVVHSSLVLHHIEPADAVAFLGELGRVARRGVIVNDLDRGRRQVIGALLLTRTLTRAEYTRTDAVLSVRRAYRPPEVEALLEAANLRPVDRRMDVLLHRYAIVAVPAR